jgi:hypothetical protein
MRCLLLVLACLAAVLAPSARAFPVHVERRPSASRNVHLRFSAKALPNGGYYYAVIVLRRYKGYTRSSPPPCATSSDMSRTDYGYVGPGGTVALALTPARSKTRHWCRGGSYEGAIYAVPHAPPCESTYPCSSELYEAPSPCWQVEGHRVVCGVVAQPQVWFYPKPLPAPLAHGTSIVARFSVKFPAR